MAIDASVDYYLVLGISRTASNDDIRRNYYKLALQYHPDRPSRKTSSVDANFHEKWLLVQKAYETLLHSRKLYDDLLASKESKVRTFKHKTKTRTSTTRSSGRTKPVRTEHSSSFFASSTGTRAAKPNVSASSWEYWRRRTKGRAFSAAPSTEESNKESYHPKKPAPTARKDYRSSNSASNWTSEQKSPTSARDPSIHTYTYSFVKNEKYDPRTGFSFKSDTQQVKTESQLNQESNSKSSQPGSQGPPATGSCTIFTEAANTSTASVNPVYEQFSKLNLGKPSQRPRPVTNRPGARRRGRHDLFHSLPVNSTDKDTAKPKRTPVVQPFIFHSMDDSRNPMEASCSKSETVNSDSGYVSQESRRSELTPKNTFIFGLSENATFNFAANDQGKQNNTNADKENSGSTDKLSELLCSTRINDERSEDAISKLRGMPPLSRSRSDSRMRTSFSAMVKKFEDTGISDLKMATSYHNERTPKSWDDPTWNCTDGLGSDEKTFAAQLSAARVAAQLDMALRSRSQSLNGSENSSRQPSPQGDNRGNDRQPLNGQSLDRQRFGSRMDSQSRKARSTEYYAAQLDATKPLPEPFTVIQGATLLSQNLSIADMANYLEIVRHLQARIRTEHEARDREIERLEAELIALKGDSVAQPHVRDMLEQYSASIDKLPLSSFVNEYVEKMCSVVDVWQREHAVDFRS